MKIPNLLELSSSVSVSLARIVSEDSQQYVNVMVFRCKSSKDS